MPIRYFSGRFLQAVACAAVGLVLGSAGKAEARKVDGDLLQAVKRNADVTTVRTLLKQGPDVNAQYPDGASALLWAAQWDNAAVAQALIAAGANIEAMNDFGVTPLAMACTNGSPGMVALLLKAGADPNHADPYGVTPLMIAARSGNAEAVKALLAKRAAVDAKESLRGQTALMWAVAEDQEPVVEALLEAGADPRAGSKNGFAPVLFAARQGNIPLVRLLLDRGVDIDTASSTGLTALHVAVVRGHVQLATVLLERGANPNLAGPGYTPLHWAVWRSESSLTLNYSAEEGELSVLGGLPDRTTKIALIKTLIAKGADINAPLKKTMPRFGGVGGAFVPYNGGGNYAGTTAFMLAAQVADVEIMQLLLANGADPLRKSDDGLTALMLAVGIGLREEETSVAEDAQLEAARLCLALGHDVNAVNQAGNIAIHAAAYIGRTQLVRFLADNGSKLQVKNKKGLTPMAWAEKDFLGGMLLHTSPQSVKLLRELGATE